MGDDCQVGESEDLVGDMTRAWCGIPPGVKVVFIIIIIIMGMLIITMILMLLMMLTQVCSGLGDLQCSVRAILGFDKKGSQFTDAVINVSTSAQVGWGW